MRSTALLLCSLGCTLAWYPKHNVEGENVFSYHGKVLTGIPELEHTYAGLVIDCDVITQPIAGFTPGTPWTGVFKLGLQNIKFSNFNEKLAGPTPYNWRTMVTPATSLVPETHKIFLESPVVVEMVDSTVTKVTISSLEPEWSVNFKKALVATIKVQLPVADHINKISRTSTLTTMPDFWTTMEQGVDGVCENTYQVTEVPSYLISPAEQGLMKPELCVGQKIFQIVRNRDTTKCTTRSMFISARGHENCLMGGCDGVTGKVAMTKFLVCGTDKDHITSLHTIINEGEHQHNLLPFNTEAVVTGTSQVLALKEMRTTQTALPAIEAPRTVEDLIYEYPKFITAEEKMQISSFRREQEHWKVASEDPANMVFSPTGGIAHGQMMIKIVEKYTELAANLQEMEHFGEKHTVATLKALQTVMLVYKLDDIKAIYTEVKDKTVERRLFLDTLKMAGTHPAFMFFKEMIETNELSFIETAEILMTLPLNIKAPTVHIIEHIFQLIKSPAVTAHPTLKFNGHMAFATIINKACFPTHHPETVLPENVFGELCHPDFPKITEEYIPHLVQELTAATDADKHSVILALGAIGHKAIIPILLPYIEGKATTLVSLRKMAIYSIYQRTFDFRKTFLPVFSAITFNPAEDRELRIAALAMTLPMDPNTVYMQKLAISTWFEHDEVVAKFVHTTLKSLTDMKMSDLPPHTTHQMIGLIEKATAVFPLCKPFPGIISSTFNYFMADMLKNLDIGFITNTAMIQGTHTFTIYHKLDMLLKHVKIVPLEFAVVTSGLKNVISEVITAMSSSSGSPVHAELQKVIQNLHISPKTEEVLMSFIWARISNDMQIVLAFPALHTDYIVAKVKSILMQNPMSLVAEAKKTVCGKTPFHFTYAYEELPYMAVVPSELGLPIFVESQATILTHMKGDVNVDCSLTIPSLELKTSKKIAYSWSGFVGTISPFTKDLLAAGVDVHRAINVPVHMATKVEPMTGTLKVEMKQLAEVAHMSHVDLVHYHVMPFTTMKPIVLVDLTPIMLSTNTKIIKSHIPKKIFEQQIGQPIGLDVKFMAETECELYDLKTMLNTLANYKYNPIIGWMFMGTETALTATGKPTIRFHKYTVVHNPQTSTTKALQVDVKLAAAYKIGSSSMVKYIASSSQRHIHEEKLSSSIANMINSEATFAGNMLVEVKLMGGLPKTYTYSLTAAKGAGVLDHKWDLHMEGDAGKLCVTGALTLPVHGVKKFTYTNTIGFGATCTQHAITMTGFTISSEKQKAYSMVSEAAKKCASLTAEVTQAYSQLYAVPVAQQSRMMEENYAALVISKENMCAQNIKEATTLDKVELEITTTSNLPTVVYTFGKYLDSAVKALLVEYITQLPNFHQKTTGPIKVVLGFNQHLGSMDMEIVSPLDKTVYNNVRLPIWTTYILPLYHSKSVMEQSYLGVTGSPLYSKCSVAPSHVSTFNNKAYSYHMDDCFHLISADCAAKTHAVLASNKGDVKHITVYYEDHKIELKAPASAYTNPSATITVYVNDVATTFNVGQTISVAPCTITWKNGYIVVVTPANTVLYNGNILNIEDKSVIIGNSNCGLCGSNNGQAIGSVASPAKCVHWSLKSVAQSYRITSPQCAALSTVDVARMSHEKSLCSSSVVSSFNYHMPATQFKVMKHATVHKQGKLCFSKIQLPECASGLTTSETENMMADFVCLPSKATATKVMARHVEAMEMVAALSSYPTTFSAMVPVAVQCTGQL